MRQYVLILYNESQTLLLGANLAKVCVLGCIFYLHGNIGSGKTTLCRGFLKALGYTKYVKSPTYTLVEFYSLSNKHIYHIDLYRLHSKDELINMGIYDCFDNKSILLIEWPKLEVDCLPNPDISISIDYYKHETYRQVVIVTCSNIGQIIVNTALHAGYFEYEVKK
ncbi:putative nucleotide-binding protein [Candidatus Blochmanniella vafra str. BVAF]|uniref:tRNA threonylcarbamoyladenosine biosynthesis protein TsaE n=1 Tax=Blochmanniella vafra (strain BVAF) TaxID=859654 RepID=E8Q6P5_BLOVB|nr:tRNA (adenosine(37)-N6)-threonylcarbamoyltransferase complex ATPase subunit type 1 TsaE [Candidatus Blochmannia vafer]ADV33486.1 putative nucleotide-binding protein [Candidatus Blochmannia vafer str. BVAF]